MKQTAVDVDIILLASNPCYME